MEWVKSSVWVETECEHIADMLKMLGREEIGSVLAEQGQIEVQCEFCNRHYRFDPIDAAQLWLPNVAALEGKTRH